MTEKERKQKQKQYDVALAIRNFEIELFWKRSLFFWGFIASAFIAYSTLVKAESPLAILIACFGFICSLAWALANRGSKRWQENWEEIIDGMDNDITGGLFKKRPENKNRSFWLSARKFSVSKLTIALSDFTVIIWFSLIVYHLIELYPMLLDVSLNLNIIFIVFTFIFAIVMSCSGRSNS